MGNYLSVSSSGRCRRRKRTYSEGGHDDTCDDDTDLDVRMHTPKRKKLMNTTKYIYNALFIDGQNSDVIIIGLGREWRLHKIYLSQSPYFCSMFGGGWKESDANVINIEVIDDKITIDALNTVFGSLYQDEVVIEPAHVVPLLGAAVMFQLENLIYQCISVMIETINLSTVINYYDAAERYGQQLLKISTWQWLTHNLLTTVQSSPQHLRLVPVRLMTDLVKCADLFVIQTEFCVYTMLKAWIFLRENDWWDGSSIVDCLTKAADYYRDNISGDDEYFLDNQIGEGYLGTFMALRLCHLVNHTIDINVIESDRIIPSSWLSPLFKDLWCSMLKVTSNVDKGPTEIDEEYFNDNCVRCGRVLENDNLHVWRWTGYSFGLDIIWTYHRRVLKLKRRQRPFVDELLNNDPSDAERISSKRNLICEVTVACLGNKQNHCTYEKTTGSKLLNLHLEREVRLMTLDCNVTFPITVSAKLRFTTIDKKSNSKSVNEPTSCT